MAELKATDCSGKVDHRSPGTRLVYVWNEKEMTPPLDGQFRGGVYKNYIAESLSLIKANSHGKFGQNPSRHIGVINLKKNGITKKAYVYLHDVYFQKYIGVLGCEMKIRTPSGGDNLEGGFENYSRDPSPGQGKLT